MLMLARLLMQGVSWTVSLWVAKLLLPFDYGLMATGMVFLGLADMLAEAGVGRALVQKETLTTGDLHCAFSLTLMLSVLLYGLLWVGAPYAATFLDMEQLTTFLRGLGVLVLLTPFRTVPMALLDRELRLGQQALVHILASLLQAATVLTLALNGFGYWALAAGAILGRILEVFTLMRAARWLPGLALPGRGDFGLIRFGVHLSLGSLLWYVYSNSDFAIVGKLLGPIELGYYALAFQLISMPVEKLTANVNQVSYPVFCRLQNDPLRLRAWYLRLTVLLGLFGMPVLVGMVLVAEDAFTLVLGPRWVPAILPFQMLSLVGVIMIYSKSVPPLLNALGRPDLNLRYTFLCTLLFPFAFWIGGQWLGLVGVCLAWMVLYPLMVTGLLWFTRSRTRVGPWQLLRAQFPVLSASLCMTGVVWTVRLALRGDELAWVRLGASIAAGVVSYAGFLLAFEWHGILADLRKLLRELRPPRADAP